MVKRDENGKVINEVIHLRTRHSDDPKQDIDQEKLLEFSLTMNPDYLVISEMKGREAFEVQKAANTGNPFITSIHANSCIDVYSRMLDLCKTKSNMDDDTLMKNVTKAFPIACFVKQLKDKSRKIMEITECIVHEDGKREFKTLFHFVRTGIKLEGNKKVITGYFEKVNNISENIQKRLLENGITEKELNKMLNYYEVSDLCN
ncbi:ATPase, T2SS/T4P/T4SS family [Clostridioides difficile]|nr:ATPase, T2SS/T4P/T4SS family [Clostridioides difficile]MDI3004233.1 ATPase, T2SS/T4P/T4SS family [Clostridioides difficile]